jgi:hypothetical protein
MSATFARFLTAGLLVAAPVALAVGSCTPPAPYTNCGNVDQVAHSDAGAYGIQAHGTDCTTARTVADSVYRHGGGYLTWRCTNGIPVTNGLGVYIWCNGANGSVVTWRES